jgi:hypothetical protein
MLKAFDYTRDKLEFERGPCGSWGNEDKLRLARQLLDMGHEYLNEDMNTACGAILLNMYLESQLSQGDRDTDTVKDIEQWHRRAIARDFLRIPNQIGR